MAFIKPIQLLCNQVWLGYQHFQTKASVTEAQKRADQEKLQFLASANEKRANKLQEETQNERVSFDDSSHTITVDHVRYGDLEPTPFQVFKGLYILYREKRREITEIELRRYQGL
jgi:hypothetical protein